MRGEQVNNEDVRKYEGLVRATASRIAPFVELPVEDIEQRLRIKVWRALATYNPKWGRAEDQYVLGCVFNEKKDILDLKRRGEIGLDSLLRPVDRTLSGDSAGRMDGFEEKHLAIAADSIYGHIEEDDFRLPSTLTGLEQRVVVLLYVQRYQTEIAIELGLSKGEMERTMRSIREKLADWRPSEAERGTAVPLPLPQRAPLQARHAA